MASLWLDRTSTFSSDPFRPRSTFDTVVAGAGLTGLVTALLLARAGKKVLVIEARTPGAVTTGNTTAKVSLLQGTVLSALRGQYSQKVVNAYVDMNREGQAWLLRYLTERGVAFQHRDSYTYATTDAGTDTLRAEMAAARAAGLGVEFTREPGLPFAVKGAVRLGRQAQVHRWKSSTRWWKTSVRTAGRWSPACGSTGSAQCADSVRSAARTGPGARGQPSCGPTTARCARTRWCWQQERPFWTGASTSPS
jgi:glycine/D-amino acid oxidase-like deaminating enzyme